MEKIPKNPKQSQKITPKKNTKIPINSTKLGKNPKKSQISYAFQMSNSPFGEIYCKAEQEIFRYFAEKFKIQPINIYQSGRVYFTKTLYK